MPSGQLDKIHSHSCEKCGRYFNSDQLVIEEEVCNICKVKDISWIKKVDYRLVDTVEKFDELEKLFLSLPEGHVLGFDTETTGLFVKKARIVGVSMSWDTGKAVYLPFRHKTAQHENNLNPETIFPKLLPLLRRFNLVFANAKYDTQMVYMETGVWLKIFSDILITRVLDDSSVAQQERRKSHFGLKETAWDLFKIEMIDFEEIVGDYPTIDYVSCEDVRLYAPADADFTRRAHLLIAEKMAVEKNPCLPMVLPLEIALIPIIAKMELMGVKIDIEYASSLIPPSKEKLKNLEHKFFSILKDKYGYTDPVSLTSPAQIIDLFYNHLELPKIMVYRKKKGRREKTLTVGKEAYSQLGEKYPIVSVYHDFVTTKKLLRDFLENFEKKSVNGIMYCSVKQLGAETGRMSCVAVTKNVGVNMQQIPKKEDKEEGLSIRKIFLARPGYKFLDVDLDQVELRIFAAESGSEKLLEAIRCGRDLHVATASSAFKTDYSAITKDQRNQAKGINYALTYGGDAGTIARKNKIPRDRAEEMFEGFFADNPSAKKWMFDIIQFAADNKFIQTRFGRRVRLVDDFRKACNYFVQSEMQDVFKAGVVRADKGIQKIKDKYGEDSINILLLVHDEVLFEVKNDPAIIKEAARVVRGAMEIAVPGLCKIVASIEVGDNWANTETYDLDVEEKKEQNIQSDSVKVKISVSSPEPVSKPPSQEKLSAEPLSSQVVSSNKNGLPSTSRIIVYIQQDVNDEAFTRLGFTAQANPGDIEVVVQKRKTSRVLPFKVSELAFDKIKSLFPMPIANVVLYSGNKLVRI